MHDTAAIVIKAMVTPFAALSAKVSIFGWQLPTYSGTKSYQNLLVEVYGGTSGTLSGSHLDAIIQNNPTSFVRSGAYRFDSGSLTYYPRTNYGFFWEATPYSATNARYLYFYSTYLTPQNNSNKGNGISLRCLVR